MRARIKWIQNCSSLLLVVSLFGWDSSATAEGINYAGIHIPDQAGKVMTVSGLVDPHALGTALMHEHLFSPEKWQIAGLRPPTTEKEIRDWSEPFTTEKRARLLSLGSKGLETNKDAYSLDSIEDAINEVRAYQELSGGTIVDVSSIGIRVADQASKLREVAKRTGIPIVIGTGFFYQRGWYPEEMKNRTVGELTKQMVRELVEGIDDTGIKAGIIGETPVENLGLLPEESNEVRVLRATARASRLTGAAISLHWSFSPSNISDQIHAGLDLLEEEGVDLSRVIVGHAINVDLDSPDDVGVFESLLRRGVYLQFDLLGYPRLERYQGSMLVAIRKLVFRGYARQILVSHDLTLKLQLTKHGGYGLTYVHSVLVPYLRSSGVSELAIRNILEDNPRRVLTLVKPRPLSNKEAAGSAPNSTRR